MTSPMTYGQEKDLVLVLKDLMSLETSLEHAKCDLALKPDFNLVDAFRIFDPMQKGWISLDEFFDGLLTLGLHSVQADLQLVF